MPDCTIRRANLADAATLARLRWEFSPAEAQAAQPLTAFQPHFMAFLQAALASGQWAIWVAEEGSRLVGTMFVEIVLKVPRPNRLGRRWGYVTNVYVAPEYRNQGLGADLMRHVQTWACEEALDFLILWPSDRAVPFYQRAGFAANGEILEWDVDDG